MSAQTTSTHVLFAHGMESGPWGPKITEMAQVAKDLGCSVESIDYQGQYDFDERVEFLQQHAASQNGYQDKRLILVGSSMGGYVSAAAVQSVFKHHPPAGLLLLAPAVGVDGYGKVTMPSMQFTMPVYIVHGWQDDVVKPDYAIDLARQHCLNLLMVNDGHRLMDSMAVINHCLQQLIQLP